MKDILTRLSGFIIIVATLAFMGWIWDAGHAVTWPMAILFPLAVLGGIVLSVVILVGAALVSEGEKMWEDFPNEVKE